MKTVHTLFLTAQLPSWFPKQLLRATVVNISLSSISLYCVMVSVVLETMVKPEQDPPVLWPWVESEAARTTKNDKMTRMMNGCIGVDMVVKYLGIGWYGVFLMSDELGTMRFMILSP